MTEPAQLPAFVGNRIVAISLAPGVTCPQRATEVLHGFASFREGGAILASERADCFASEGAGGVALGSRLALSPDIAGPLDAVAIVARLPDKPELQSPAVAIASESGRLTCWADRYGIGQLFIYRSAGIAAVSSSATLLAEMFACGPDRDALIGFALTGNFLAEASAFVGVSKLAPGERLVLQDGKAHAEAAASPLAYRGRPVSSLEEVTEAFVAAVRRMHEAFPDAELELSGGLDSRLILAALPEAARRGKRAMTIGPADSGDARMAALLAEREGLVHRLVPSDGFAALGADELQSLIEQVAVGYDHLANPLDKLAIVSAGMAASERPRARFGGQNGEILRGFYYAGQPIERAPSEQLARRLLAWRLETNDRVSDELLDVPGYREIADATRERIVATLLEESGDHWWQSLDRLYLTQRMPRWVGASATNRFIARTSLYPFFDPDFVDAAMRLPGPLKLNSQAAYRMLTRIDLGLALVPLDNGKTPGRVENKSLSYLMDKVNIVTKVYSKVKGKVFGKSKHVLGSASAIEQWYGLSLSKRLPVKSLNETGLVSRNAVESLATSGRRFDRASLGWLLLVESLTRSDQWDCADGSVNR